MAPKTPRAGTRSSSRLAGKSSSPASAQTSPSTKTANAEPNGSAKKRKAAAAVSPSDRSEKKAKPEQKTLEETVAGSSNAEQPVDGSNHDHDAAPEPEAVNNASATDKHDEEMKDPPASDDKPDGDTKEASAPADKHEQDTKEPSASADKQGEDAKEPDGSTETHKDMKEAPASTEEAPANEAASAKDDAPKPSTDGAVEESSQREKAMPSNILEKGILYFFTRPRVGIEDPKQVQDLARSYIVMRPLPAGAKLGDGPIDDLKNNRVIALPKKSLPKSHSDRFMAFVEKHSTSVATLKEEFMSSSTYQTQTLGERKVQPVTPIAEGVYAITTTGRESHLAYMLTIPSELGEVQEALGLAAKGSFIVSTKNPESKGPANAQLDESASFSKEIMADFRGRSWMPSEPSHLDYEKCQILLIGEGHGTLAKAVNAEEKDEKSDEKKTPEEEMELLEHEDLKRVESLRGDDSVFDDLGLSKNEYPKVPTTW